MVSACKSDVPGQPSASSSSTSTAAPSSNGHESHTKAPRVASPLEPAKYVESPCTTLTQEQQQEFNVRGPGTPQDVEGDPSCRWEIGSNGDTSISLTFARKLPDGLSHLYALDETGWWKNGYFEPATVSGYPAVYNGISDLRDGGSCGISTAATDTMFFSVDLQARPGNDSCVAAKNVATAVIETIKKGA
ncbi:DUF3558 domain-containing protein [Amycolatopsis sp. lyj-112]|uniref:DUF3558 domain-containing protein n=1 Tax=Amycolatopsis sp. lyj-112 TaxID=2789288 RepID=UPI00397A9F76